MKTSDTTSAVLKDQYELIKGTRQVLFSYCDTFAPDDFIKGLEGFTGKSIPYLLIHIANTYRFWLEKFAMNKNITFFNADDASAVSHVRDVYKEVDDIVEKFLKQFENQFTDSITRTIPSRNREYTTTPFILLTHVMTHEFHHKGQILSISRALGYTPVDTDIIRF